MYIYLSRQSSTTWHRGRTESEAAPPLPLKPKPFLVQVIRQWCRLPCTLNPLHSRCLPCALADAYRGDVGDHVQLQAFGFNLEGRLAAVMQQKTWRFMYFVEFEVPGAGSKLNLPGLKQKVSLPARDIKALYSSKFRTSVSCPLIGHRGCADSRLCILKWFDFGVSSSRQRLQASPTHIPNATCRAA